MKKNILFIASGVLLALSVGCISTAVLKSAKLTHEVQGASSLPTTVDLNDTSESEIRNYYSYLNNLDDSERRGQNLLKNLKYILTNNPAYPSKTVTYYSYNEVRSIYRITDRNWYSSPASGISGYNSSTKIITNFDYSSDPYLYYYYRDDNFTNPHTATAQITSSAGSTQTLLNQEHIWSKSHGFSEGNGVPNAGSDLHHLVAADVAVNKWGHSNYSYGYVDTNNSSWTSTRSNWDNGANAILNNKLGTPLHPSSSDEESLIFEPRDEDKGDFARALLYMVARYNYIGQSTFTPSIEEPNLTLVNHIISGSTTINTTTQNSVAEYGNLDDILLFHKADPVVTNSNQDFEVHRNNLIYTNYQHTRNPFIDFPEWVDLIWGDKKDTGVARPQTDTINGYNTVSGYITLSDTSLSLTTGNTHNLTATASNGATVSFSSSNSTVASVNSSGRITANSAGNATITVSATIEGNVVTATCTVTVSNPVATVTSVTVSPANLSLDVYNNTTGNVSATVNGTNNPPQTVTWTTSNSAVATVSSSGVVAAVGTGNATITATSTYNNSMSGSCSVTVTDSTPTLTSIMVQNPKTTYNAGDTFEVPTVIATYNGNTSHAVTGATFSGYNMVSAGQQTVTVSYTERGVTQTTSYTITVVAADTYTDTLNNANTINSSTSTYTSWDNKTYSSPAVYAGKTAGTSSTVQLTNATDKQSGIVSTSSGGYVSSVSVVWNSKTSTNGRSLYIYGKNSSYSSPADLFNESTRGKYIGKLDYPYSTDDDLTFTFNNNYQYVGLYLPYEVGGAAYFESISIKWSSSELPAVSVTGFNITPDSASVRVGKSYQLATAFTPVYATNQNVTWTSSNTSVATVTSGLVTGVSSGFATITATTEDGNFVSTCTVSVVDSSTLPYILGLPYKLFINNTSNSKTYYFNGSLSANNYYGASTESYSSAKDIYFEQNGTGYNIYFMNGSPAVKTYIDVTVSGSYHNFSITTSNPNFVWYYETTEGYLYIIDGTTNWRIGGYSTYDTFAVYDASRTNIYDAQYKETVEVFSYYVMNKITCDASGVDTPEFETDYSWSNLSSIYNSLDSSEKQEFASASAIENSSNIVERAAYRYDYIIWKYGTSSYANFASRSISPRVKVSPILSDSAITIPLLILGSLFGATSLGIFLTIRKRKEQ